MFEQFLAQFDHLPDFLRNTILFGIAIIIGLIVKFILTLILRKKPKTGELPHFSVTRSIISRLGKPFNYFLPLLALNFMLPLMKMPPRIYNFLDKTVGILLALSFANVLISIVKIFEDYAYHSFDISKANNLRERKIRTQLQFIRRLAISVIIILTVCLILLSFNNLRKLGAGLLTGVGVGGIIIGFAAQKSLGNLLAGFQIAFTQPLRIDDVLVVEGEWGRVEEITLTYVVLNIWDQRRLILPINYFIEKPFQNWTRNSADILGTVFLYLDYSVPMDLLRKELDRLLEINPLWDKRVKVMQITNASEKTIEVRALMSASSSGNAFDLRCDVREGLIKFVQCNYPGSLPVQRITGPALSTLQTAGLERASAPAQAGSISSETASTLPETASVSSQSGTISTETGSVSSQAESIPSQVHGPSPSPHSTSSESSSSMPGVSRSSPDKS